MNKTNSYLIVYEYTYSDLITFSTVQGMGNTIFLQDADKPLIGVATANEDVKHIKNCIKTQLEKDNININHLLISIVNIIKLPI